MTRRTGLEVEREARWALLEALGRVGAAGEIVDGDGGEWDFVVDVQGSRFAVIAKTVVTAGSVHDMIGRYEGSGMPVVVVADRIAQGAKDRLREAGLSFFDLRGELRLTALPLFIDTVLSTGRGHDRPSSAPLSSQVAKEAAIACLATPDRGHGVREVARWIDRSASSVSDAMRGLRDAGLVTASGKPLCPELFFELLGVWHSSPVRLAAVPDTTSQRVVERLGLGLEDVEGSVGWALTGTVGAALWGIPIVARGDYPPDFVVPDAVALRAARLMLRPAEDPETRGCTVAVAPVRLACLRRVDRGGLGGVGWPVVNHILAALDIGQDAARGLEAINRWRPEGIVRAW
ncbi:hypothetical protein [Candidatus Poriferisodalis sp.]|uniref:hypothetical protein n=1 Tax=Candidatus Poriferisodalis sp. TaxID=3101277 RepID=UPI003B011F03